MLVPPIHYTWPSASTYTELYTCCQIEASCIMTILLFQYINILWQAYTPPPQSLHLMKHNQSIQFAQQHTALICGDHSVCPVLLNSAKGNLLGSQMHISCMHLCWNTRQCEDLTRNMLHTTAHKKASHITRADTNFTYNCLPFGTSYNMRQVFQWIMPTTQE